MAASLVGPYPSPLVMRAPGRKPSTRSSRGPETAVSMRSGWPSRCTTHSATATVPIHTGSTGDQVISTELRRFQLEAHQASDRA